MSRFASNTHQYPIDKVNPFIPILWPLPGEYWKEITEREVPDILPYYAISNYGRIVHIFKNSLMSLSWDGPGYVIALLRTKRGTVTFRVHRLMMLVFKYREDADNLMVDHINGDKKANYLDFPVYNPITNQYELQDNLRWVTREQNIYYAYNDPVQRSINNVSPNASFVQEYEKVREICELLQEGKLTYRDIAKKTGVNLGVVQNIRFRKCWQYISKDYEFPDKSKDDRIFTDENVHDICKMLQDGEKIVTIAKKYNVPVSTIKNIKYGKCYFDISKKYTFNH